MLTFTLVYTNQTAAVCAAAALHGNEACCSSIELILLSVQCTLKFTISRSYVLNFIRKEIVRKGARKCVKGIEYFNVSTCNKAWHNLIIYMHICTANEYWNRNEIEIKIFTPSSSYKFKRFTANSFNLNMTPSFGYHCQSKKLRNSINAHFNI